MLKCQIIVFPKIIYIIYYYKKKEIYLMKQDINVIIENLV